MYTPLLGFTTEGYRSITFTMNADGDDTRFPVCASRSSAICFGVATFLALSR